MIDMLIILCWSYIHDLISNKFSDIFFQTENLIFKSKFLFLEVT